MGEKRILIVDDSVTMRQLLIMAVRKLDFGQLALTEAVDGQDGYEKFNADYFDLIITDIKMPNMTGLQLIEKIRNELGNKTVPIIVVSTKGDEADIQRALSLGADEYLLKPLSTISLKNVINKLLGQE